MKTTMQRVAGRVAGTVREMNEAQRLALPASFYGSAGRDKQGATL